MAINPGPSDSGPITTSNTSEAEMKSHRHTNRGVDGDAYGRDLLKRLMSEVRPYCRPSMVNYDCFPVFKEAVDYLEKNEELMGTKQPEPRVRELVDAGWGVLNAPNELHFGTLKQALMAFEGEDESPTSPPQPEHPKAECVYELLKETERELEKVKAERDQQGNTLALCEDELHHSIRELAELNKARASSNEANFTPDGKYNASYWHNKFLKLETELELMRDRLKAAQSERDTHRRRHYDIEDKLVECKLELENAYNLGHDDALKHNDLAEENGKLIAELAAVKKDRDDWKWAAKAMQASVERLAHPPVEVTPDATNENRDPNNVAFNDDKYDMNDPSRRGE